MKYYQEIGHSINLAEPQVAYQKSHPGVAFWGDLMIKSIISRTGIRKLIFEQLKDSFGLTNSEFKTIFSTTWKSIQNKTEKELISGPATDRAINLMELWDEGLDYFGDEMKFTNWLSKQSPLFEGESPISLLDTPAGVEMARRKVGQLKHGITA